METESLDQFADIDDKMLWKQSALNQINEFEALADRLGAKLEVVGSHTSKSICLPVVKFYINGCQFYLRDNFYDVNVCVLAAGPIGVPLAVMFKDVYEPKTWDWYLNEIARCRGYSWRGWSDAQMDDPELLKLYTDAPYFMMKSAEDKHNWIKRMTDPTWFSTQWSLGSISWDGEFGPGANLYIQGYPFMEGIGALVPDNTPCRYAPGCSAFSLAVNCCEEAELIIRRVSAPLT